MAYSLKVTVLKMLFFCFFFNLQYSIMLLYLKMQTKCKDLNSSSWEKNSPYLYIRYLGFLSCIWLMKTLYMSECQAAIQDPFFYVSVCVPLPRRSCQCMGSHHPWGPLWAVKRIKTWKREWDMREWKKGTKYITKTKKYFILRYNQVITT